jgi:hypothetical protein
MYQINSIGNYYGCLWLSKKEDKFYWLIENYDTDFHDLKEWVEIPEKLYIELLKEVTY